MAVQTSISTAPSAAFNGMLGDLKPNYVRSYANAVGSAVPFGVLVKPKSGDEQDSFDAFSASAFPLGVLAHTHAYENADLTSDDGVASADMANVLRQGTIWVTVDGDVTVGAQAYARHTANGAGKLEIGRFRADNDGVAQVTTLTPTVANSTVYSVQVMAGGKLFWFTYTSDSSAGAAEIVTGFKALMAANADFTALVTASGTTTLILTGVDEGVEFFVTPGGTPGVWTSITETVAASTYAELIAGCRFLTAASATGLALLEVNLPQ